MFRVFRDREELSAAQLSQSIEEALKSSRKLIVICSKRTPLSPWCLKEVSRFLELRGPEHIIPVLIEGEPDEAFPPQLLQLSKEKTDSDGNTITEPIELLAADLRPESMKGRALPGFEDLENSNDPNLSTLRQEPVKKLKTEKYRVLASMLDCSFGDLKQKMMKKKKYLK